MWDKTKEKAERVADKSREKYRTKLKQHVKKHNFLKENNRHGWEMGCWLGKEPTGRLFMVKASADKMGDMTQLANDMWDFLFTPKGEEIMRAEQERGETWKNRLWNNWNKKGNDKDKQEEL